MTTKNITIYDKDKLLIINLFNKNLKGKKFMKNKGDYCGSDGHFIENCFGIKHNSNNEPDILGYEIKKISKKISFGDWSASEYIFNKKTDVIKKCNKNIPNISKTEFLRIFGKPNIFKNNRYSWSGSCVPKHGGYNDYGQTLVIDDNKNIYAI